MSSPQLTFGLRVSEGQDSFMIQELCGYAAASTYDTLYVNFRQCCQ